MDKVIDYDAACRRFLADIDIVPTPNLPCMAAHEISKKLYLVRHPEEDDSGEL